MKANEGDGIVFGSIKIKIHAPEDISDDSLIYDLFHDLETKVEQLMGEADVGEELEALGCSVTVTSLD